VHADVEGTSQGAKSMPRFNQILCLFLFVCVLRVQMFGGEQPIPSNSPSTPSGDSKQQETAEQADIRPEEAQGPSAIWVGKDFARILKGDRIQLSDTNVNANNSSGVARRFLMAPLLQSSVNQYSFNLSLHSHSFMGQTLVGAAGMNAMGLISTLTRHKSTTTYAWALRGTTSLVTVTNDPTFEVHYSGLPGVDTGEFQPVIVKLTPTLDNWRRVGVMHAKVDPTVQFAQGVQLSPFIEDRVAAQVTMLERGTARISATNLVPGDYALVLRFRSASAKIAISDLGSDHGNWLVLGQAWAFTVKIPEASFPPPHASPVNSPSAGVGDSW
jgi:hypothetical protein